MAAGADTHKLVSQLPPDTAESVLAWLASRGKDVPVHIPVKTIRFARECFQLIDTDGSGTLEPAELRAVFTALGRPASLRQVSRLVESVAGAGATSLRFSDFAQMMHGAVSSRRREEAELEELMQADVNVGGQAGRGGGAEDEPPLQWTDFHLLAKAFRRRVVVDGVINNSAGWREKVLSLAERQAASSRAATANAASMWRHRAARLGRRGEGAGGQAGTAAAEGGGGSKPGSAASPPSAPSAPSARQLGREESDMLAGAVSAEATPRAGLAGTDIVVDESPREQGGKGIVGPNGSDSPDAQKAQQAQHAAVQQARQAEVTPQRQMSPIVQQLVSRLRSNATAAADATGSEQQALAALRTVSGSMGRSWPGSASASHAAPSPLSRAVSSAVAGMPAATNGGASTGDASKLSQRWLSRPGLSLQSCLSRAAGPQERLQEGPQERPPCTPAMSAFAGGSLSEAARAPEAVPLPEAGSAADAAHVEPDEADVESIGAADRGAEPADAIPGRDGYDWRSTAARMHQAAAASRAAAAGPGSPPAAPPPCPVTVPAAGTTTPRPSSLATGSRLLVPTDSSRARTAAVDPPVGPQTGRSVPIASGDSETECSRRRQHTHQMWQQAGRPVEQAQRRRLVALALVRGGADSA